MSYYFENLQVHRVRQLLGEQEQYKHMSFKYLMQNYKKKKKINNRSREQRLKKLIDIIYTGLYHEVTQACQPLREIDIKHLCIHQAKKLMCQDKMLCEYSAELFKRFK